MSKFLFLSIVLVLIVTPVFYIKASEPIKILLVPGHDNKDRGAQYGSLSEAAMNLAIASRIYDVLKKDKRFEVHVTRNLAGYTPEFVDYLTHQEDIISFRENAKQEMQKRIEDGSFIKKEDTVDHNTASEDVSVILYGINKWANENKMDAVIHIHFNDYPRSRSWTAGKYKGFAIYIPDEELPNWKESGLLAVNIFVQLNKKYITSTYPKEKGGLMPGQSLIALGSNGSLLPSVRSVLIEYGYIYSLGNSVDRHKKYDSMASLTATGIKNHFLSR